MYFAHDYLGFWLGNPDGERRNDFVLDNRLPVIALFDDYLVEFAYLFDPGEHGLVILAHGSEQRHKLVAAHTHHADFLENKLFNLCPFDPYAQVEAIVIIHVAPVHPFLL